MALIGKIAIGLTARTGEFTRDFKRAGATVKSFSGRVARIAKTVAVAGAAAATAAVGVATGVAVMIRRQMQAIDSTSKLADRIGETTENLVGLQYAASITGISQEALGKALQYLGKSLGEARLGIGEAKYGLEALGLSFEAIIAKSPAEALMDIAEAMKDSKTQSDRLFAATKLFGRGGVELVNLLMEGKQGIQELIVEADKLGLSYSRIDAAQVEAANDALTRMQGLFTGMIRQLAPQVAPFITAAADELISMATAGEGMGVRVVDAFESVITVVAELADAVSFLDAAWNTVSGTVRGGAGIFVKFESVVNRPFIELGKLIPGIGSSVEELDDTMKAFSDITLEDAANDFEQAGVAYKAFESGAMATKTGKLIGDIRTKGRAAAEAAVAGAAAAGTPGTERGATEQDIKSRQLDETNLLLRDIKDRVGYASAG